MSEGKKLCFNCGQQEITDIKTGLCFDCFAGYDGKGQKALGRKDDQGKLDWSLVDLNQFEGLVKVLMYGEKKYSRGNWQHVKNFDNRYKAALFRHLIECMVDLNARDEESGLLHIDQAIANLYFLKHGGVK